MSFRYTSVRINDSIWLAGGSLVVGAGNQIYLFGRFLDRDTPVPSPPACAKGVQLDSDEPEDIFQLVAQQNGPLWDYHPTLLAQCLLWGMQLLATSADLADIVQTRYIWSRASYWIL